MIKIEFPIDIYTLSKHLGGYCRFNILDKSSSLNGIKETINNAANTDSFFLLPNRSKLDNSKENRDLILSEFLKLVPKIICSSKLMDVLKGSVSNFCYSVSVKPLDTNYQQIILQFEGVRDVKLTIEIDKTKEKIVAEIMRELVTCGFLWDWDKKKFFKI